MRRWARIRRFLHLVSVGGAAALSGCGDRTSDAPTPAAESGDPGPIHVHGLGVNPSDGSLFVATHTGLFRAAPNETRAVRVGDRYQDTMGFTVVGPNRFLGSGHPDGREQLPPYLGLIESGDAGRSWQPVSLLGKADFHVLEASGRRIYGYGSDFESRQPQFLTSTDGGQSWRRLQAPEPLISLSISPEDPRALIASGEGGIFRSTDAGRSWSEVDAPSAGLIAWTSAGVILIDLDGRVWGSADPATGQWRPVGELGGQPAALETGPDDELLVALHDGVIHRSTDGGRTWAVRSRP